MPEQHGGTLAAIAGALVALAVVAAWTMWPDRGPSAEVAIRRAATDPAVRFQLEDLPCPAGGRGPGPADVAWPRVDQPAPETTVRRGQAIPFEILLRVPDHAGPRDRAAFDVALTPYRDRGPAAFDPDRDLGCVFVDTGDPLTVDAGAPASVAVEPDAAAGARLTVSGLDPGDTVVIEAWAVVTGAPTARTGSAKATVRAGSTPGGLGVSVDESTVRVPLEFGTDAGVDALAVSIDDGDTGGAPGERLDYRIVVENAQALDVVNDVRIVAAPSASTTVEGFAVVGEGAAATSCELEEAPPLLRCATSHLDPGQTVALTFAARIADVATPQWLREQGPCTSDDSDICMQVEVTWTGAGRGVDALVTSEPAAVLGVHPSIGLAKYPVTDPSDPDGAVVLEYSVISAVSVPLDEVLVLDDGCTDVVFADGDTNDDDLLDPSEEWRFRCRGPAADALATRAVVRAVQSGVPVGDVAVVGP